MITKIDHVVLFVTDMNEAVDFYTNTLGFEVAYPSPEYTSLEVPGSTSIGLHIAEKVTGVGADGATTQVSFGVEDIDASFMKLEEKGVSILREIEEIAPGKFMFNFEDPFGNSLSCYENRS